jgi:endonuclease-3 related protein
MVSKMGILAIYRKLYASFGPQHWWPAETPFEVMVGAILTQNTSWQNVERAIAGIKRERLLTAKKLWRLPQKKLARLLRPAGYYNLKAIRLKNFLGYFRQRYAASPAKMRRAALPRLREELLRVNGIGPETADSILLYALGKPVFVVDAYTKRVLSRHRLAGEDASYEEAQNLFMRKLKKEVKLFNEFHALLVKLGKDFCRKRNPRCHLCPLNK